MQHGPAERGGLPGRIGQCSWSASCETASNLLILVLYTHRQAEQSLQDTREFTSFVQTHCASTLGKTPNAKSRIPGPALVQPIITPRFAIACSDPLLKGLGEMLAEDETLACQTHLSENPSEIEFTKCEWVQDNFNEADIHPVAHE